MVPNKSGNSSAVWWVSSIWLLVAWLASACDFPSYGFSQSEQGVCLGPGCAGSAGQSFAGQSGSENLGGQSNGGESGGSRACAIGYADCNGVSDDGCEVALGSTSDCKGCGEECLNDHGVTTCSPSDDAGLPTCSPTCAPGYADCDLNPNNGCETNIHSDAFHCGSCGKACTANGGTPLCQGGLCGVSSCNFGFGDCSNSGACVSNLNSDPKNCGRCGHICSNAHGSPVCNGGRCQIACDSGYGDCNGSGSPAPPDDGCEIKLNVPDSSGSVANCGECGAACVRRAYTTIDLQQCALGVCARNCFAGLADCDNNRNDPACVGSGCGCESNITNDAAQCGACGHACLGGACVNSVCQCPDIKPKSGSTRCSLSSTLSCGPYSASGCRCTCKSGLFQCQDAGGNAC